MKYKSCAWIEAGINFDRDSYKVCCLYSAKGGGNTIIEDNYKGKPVDWNKVFEFKKMMKDMHKAGQIYPKCEGCIYLKEAEWEDNHEQIAMINLDYWTKCNSRCSYCFTMENKWQYNHFKNYNFLPILKDMIAKNILVPYGHVSFGGGEVTLLKEFEKVLNILIDKGFKLIIIHTSCIKYSKAIEKGLRNGCVELIVSVDSGSKEMHKKIKQVSSHDKVWRHLKRYAQNQKNKDEVRTKYIVIPGVNDSIDELRIWLEKSKNAGIHVVLQEIESKWFYARRDKVDKDIMELFRKTKQMAEEMGLEYQLYERAEHMMSFWEEKEGAREE